MAGVAIVPIVKVLLCCVYSWYFQNCHLSSQVIMSGSNQKFQ